MASVAFALDVTAVILSVAAALCAWRSCAWLAAIATRADADLDGDAVSRSRPRDAGRDAAHGGGPCAHPASEGVGGR